MITEKGSSPRTWKWALVVAVLVVFAVATRAAYEWWRGAYLSVANDSGENVWFERVTVNGRLMWNDEKHVRAVVPKSSVVQRIVAAGERVKIEVVVARQDSRKQIFECEISYPKHDAYGEVVFNGHDVDCGPK